MPHRYINELLQRNQAWIEEQIQTQPDYFERNAEHQQPQVLWVGCSDSRVSPNEITQSGKGELFVHRNIANLVVYTDFNFLSVLQYAVEVLKVQHIIVCGHYNCGGVKAAMTGHNYGLIDNWLRPIKDTLRFYEDELALLPNEDARFDRLVELNVLEQISHLGNTNIVQNAWASSPFPYLHGWVYDLHTGRIKTLAGMINTEKDLQKICKFER